MKLPVALLATVVVGCASSLLAGRKAPKSLATGEEAKAPRKLSLFVRTKDVSKSNNCGGQVPCFDVFGSAGEAKSGFHAGGGGGSPSFGGGGGGPVPGGHILQGPAQPNTDCHPKCFWSCGNADCDETCDPVCAPPQCETACAQLNLLGCRQQCQPPKCAIVCPTQHCEHGGCPACKTICAPPKCTTECSEQCESKCSEPQCTWKCNPGKCEKPRCSLTCGGAQACGLDGNLNARPPPFREGMTVLAKGLASADPKSLAAFSAKGAKPKAAAKKEGKKEGKGKGVAR